MKPKSLAIRRTKNYIINTISGLSALLGLFFLVWIIYEVVARGLDAFNWDLITELPKPPGSEGGGFANAIVGTFVITGLAAAFAVPIGILTGIFLSEFGKDSKFANSVRFAITILLGTPSIIVGVFAYTFLVIPWWFLPGQLRGVAAVLALFVIMLPVVARTTEDMLSLVPNALREAALALGMPKWRMTFSVIFRAARSGLVTGMLLAIARVSGETAPLLFTAGDSAFWPSGPSSSIANMTVKIYYYSTMPYDYSNKLAWAASLLITIGVLSVNIFSRLLFSRGKK
ncbi:MAG: phosphate ABC transporter permease PstA [Planctomycetota bacterium]